MGCRTAPSATRAGSAPAASTTAAPRWERDNPALPLPTPPLGMEVDWTRSRVTLTPEKVRLGRWLFHDARLSRDGTVSCATCHQSEHAFADTAPRSRGVGGLLGVRKSPPIVNAGFPVLERYFWDGRASSLAEQAQGPIVNPVEMANTVEGVVATVSAIAGYRRAFRAVYGDDRIDMDRVADAIAAYETTRLSGNSAYDRFNAGDSGALSPLAKEGLQVFFGRGRCNACHLGPGFSDSGFHNVGIGYDGRRDDLVHTGFSDPGRYAVTHEPADIGAFKTPTLRDVARHPPYMHDGSSPDLEDAILRYVHVQSNPWLDPAMNEVRVFPFDVPALVAFLEALDGTGYQDVPPSSLPE